MRFVCPDHGEQDQVQHNGYSLGHRTGRDGPNELDLEGITFIFDVVSNESEDDLELELAEYDARSSYLEKFADWEAKITEAAEGEFEHHCPECGELMFWLEDDEEVPEL